MKQAKMPERQVNEAPEYVIHLALNVLKEPSFLKTNSSNNKVHEEHKW